MAARGQRLGDRQPNAGSAAGDHRMGRLDLGVHKAPFRAVVAHPNPEAGAMLQF